MSAEPRLGSKIFYKIGEVSKIAKLPTYVLRFWESQFDFLKPKKNRGNQRVYLRRDIETALEIKRMLYEEGYTIAGVQRVWTKRGRSKAKHRNPRDVAKRVQSDLRGILRILESYD